jgi:hypothetical protein
MIYGTVKAVGVNAVLCFALITTHVYFGEHVHERGQ